MRKILLIVVLALLSAPMWAQVSNPGVKYVPVAPSGSCPAHALPVQVAYSNAICTCGAGTWSCNTGGGSGSGTVSSGGPYAIPGYGAGTSTTVGPTNITTDATGNNLNVPGNVAAGTTNPVSIGGATGSCTGKYANADGTGCSTATEIVNGQPISPSSVTTGYFNGTVMADQFAGADFCAKLRGAELWALANNQQLVDATHFGSTVSCASDPFASLTGGHGVTVKLTVLLPASFISTTVPWLIDSTGMTIIGQGRAETIIAYTGVGVVSAVVSVGDSTTGAYYPNYVALRNMSIIGHLSNATDGLRVYDAGLFEGENLSFWGITGDGLHTYGATVPTLKNIHVVSDEATRFGYFTGYSVPTHGIEFGPSTTAGVISVPDIQGVSGAGLQYTAGQQMVLKGGTSEGNGSGVALTSNSGYNTFEGFDMEANTANTYGVDVSDAGVSNQFTSSFALSACSACQSVASTSVGGTRWVGGVLGTYFNGNVQPWSAGAVPISRPTTAGYASTSYGTAAVSNWSTGLRGAAEGYGADYVVRDDVTGRVAIDCTTTGGACYFQYGTVMGPTPTKLLYRCDGGTQDGAIVFSPSTQATACTTGVGTLVSLLMYTP